MDRRTEVVEVRLPNGVVMGVEVPRPRGAQDVGVLPSLRLRDLEPVIEGLSDLLVRSLERARPQRAMVELGLSLEVESGRLTGVLVQAGGAASLRLSLTWERRSEGGGSGGGDGDGE